MNIGLLYEEGIYVEKKQFQSFVQLFESSRFKWQRSIYKVGTYHRATYVQKTDNSLVIKYLKRASGKRHPESVYTLGCLHRNGEGVDKSIQKAVRLFKRAARPGWNVQKWASCCEE